MAGTLFQVRIPKWARRHFGGKSRVSERYHDEGLGAAWQRRVLNQLEAIRQGVEAERAGIPQKARPVALQPAAEMWLESLQRREKTIEGYRWALAHVFRLAGRTPLSDFGVSEWDAYVTRRRAEEASADALNRERQALQAAAKWAAARGFSVNPQIFTVAKLRSAPVVVRRFDPDVMDAALATLEGRDRVIAELVAGTGLRSRELRCARADWINWREHFIQVPHSEEFSPKGARARRLPLAPQLERRLRDWLGGRRSGLLFPPTSQRRTATGLGMQSLIRRLKVAMCSLVECPACRARERAPCRDARGRKLDPPHAERQAAPGVPVRTGLHDLRHHYISQLAARGLDIVTVQQLAGHTTLKMTQLYMHARPGFLEEARRVLGLPMQPRKKPKKPKRRSR